MSSKVSKKIPIPPQIQDRAAILVFVKDPQAGQVKTRLAASIGDIAAASLYRAFVADVMETVTMCASYDCWICFSPPESEAAIRAWLGDDHRFIPQAGADLGLRMTRAFEQTFSQGYDRLILIGTDIPQIQPNTLNAAFSALTETEAVIGPATDGGYYLIGFRKTSFTPDVFRNIAWGSDTVKDDTLGCLSAIGCGCFLLPSLRDIDDVEDLKALRLPSETAPHTTAAVSRLGLDMETAGPGGKMSLNVRTK